MRTLAGNSRRFRWTDRSWFGSPSPSIVSGMRRKRLHNTSRHATIGGCYPMNGGAMRLAILGITTQARATKSLNRSTSSVA